MENFYMVSTARQRIIEEIGDVYLAYLYDKNVKGALIKELVLNVWNQQASEGQGMLDPSSVAEYVIEQTR